MKFAKSGSYVLVLLAGILAAGAPAIHLACPAALAADESKETLNNASIMEMQSINLGDSVIIDKIRTSKCDFDVTVAALKMLKEAKVSDAVIQAMIAAKAPATMAAPPPAAAVEAPPAPAGDINDPHAQHSAGVWLCEETGGVKKMTPLSGESYRIWAGGGPFGSATRAVLSGLASKIQVSSHRPVFYMYFGGEGNGGFGAFGTATPGQLPLAKLDLKPKTQERLLIIGSAAPFAGYNSGIPKKNLQDSNAEKIAPGVYKVTPAADLAPGEYAFCFYGSEIQAGTAGRMFTFGVPAR